MKWLWLIVGVVVLALLATRNLRRAAPGQPPPGPITTVRSLESCDRPQGFQAVARRNAASLASAPWAPFGVPETGWDAYAPSIAHEIRTGCGPTTAGFAAALAGWQKDHKLSPTGEVEANTFEAMRVAWMLRRPFVTATRDGSCPAEPAPGVLAPSRPDEGYFGKVVQLRPGALAAYRRLREAARREVPAVQADPALLALVSGYRSAATDAERCRTQACGGPARANCSAHRTGLAVDLYLGAAPGHDPISSAEPNRSYQAATPAYRWLVANAERFGFVPYPYEPWHWEWTGEPVVNSPS